MLRPTSSNIQRCVRLIQRMYTGKPGTLAVSIIRRTSANLYKAAC